MDKLREQFSRIPWDSFERQTPISQLARSVLPVGNFPTRMPSRDAGLMVALGEPDYEKYLMDIQGTAFQVRRGDFSACTSEMAHSTRFELLPRIYRKAKPAPVVRPGR
jgi:hypothetical protein